MRMRKYKVGTPLLIFWLDTVEDPRWRTEPDAHVAVIKNYGEYLKHDENFLYIASSVGSNEFNQTEIPIGMVKRVYLLSANVDIKTEWKNLVKELKES